MAYLLIAKEDDIVKHLLAQDLNEFYDKALDLLRERVEAGYWYHYPDDAQERAEAIVASGDGKAAWQFLDNRRDHEYEWVERVTV